MPYLEDGLDLTESVKPTSESCMVVYRGELYVYGQGSTNFVYMYSLFQYVLPDVSLSLIFVVLTLQDKFSP